MPVGNVREELTVISHTTLNIAGDRTSATPIPRPPNGEWVVGVALRSKPAPGQKLGAGPGEQLRPNITILSSHHAGTRGIPLSLITPHGRKSSLEVAPSQVRPVTRS